LDPPANTAAKGRPAVKLPSAQGIGTDSNGNAAFMPCLKSCYLIAPTIEEPSANATNHTTDYSDDRPKRKRVLQLFAATPLIVFCAKINSDRHQS
jgi:hypothetical protein